MGWDSSLCTEQTGLAGLGWVHRHFNWGPHGWPLYWCEMVALSKLDCGALAVISREALRRRGATPLAIQLLQRAPTDSAEHWQVLWNDAGETPDWVFGPLWYHEVVGVEVDSHLAVFDSTEGYPILPKNVQDRAGVLAARVQGSPEGGWRSPSVIEWAGWRLPVGVWATSPFT